MHRYILNCMWNRAAASHIDSTEKEREDLVQSDLNDSYMPRLGPVLRAACQENGNLALEVYATFIGQWNRNHPYPVDLSTVAVVDIGGSRVELGKLNLVTK